MDQGMRLKRFTSTHRSFRNEADITAAFRRDAVGAVQIISVVPGEVCGTVRKTVMIALNPASH
jgi:hypothetical protein